MQITSCEITNTKYIQIYLTEEERRSAIQDLAKYIEIK